MKSDLQRFALFLLFSFAALGVDDVHAQSRASTLTCEDGRRVGSRGCPAEEFLLGVLQTEGVRPAMDALERLVAIDADVRRDAHGYAHAIGIAAYDGTEEVGEVFAQCTPAHQSGCYHGVIQSYFVQHMAEHGGHLDPIMVNELCREQRDDPDQRWLLFQCAHGMGHGLVALVDRHLPASLEGCDLIEFAWEREACYGGAFMENIVHETAPHHAVGRPDTEGHGAHGAAIEATSGQHHGDHRAATTPSRDPFPPLDKDDPFYPCSALDARYAVSCYQMQTSAILYFNGYDVPAAAATCADAPEAYRSVCFQSLGRDISSMTGQDHDRARTFCGSAPADYEPWCHLGYAKNLVDLTADSQDGLAYCRLLPAGESKRFCYVAMGEQIWVLAEAPEQRSVLCRGAEEEYIDACRHGAGLTSEVMRQQDQRNEPGLARALGFGPDR